MTNDYDGQAQGFWKRSGINPLAQDLADSLLTDPYRLMDQADIMYVSSGEREIRRLNSVLESLPIFLDLEKDEQDVLKIQVSPDSIGEEFDAVVHLNREWSDYRPPLESIVKASYAGVRLTPQGEEDKMLSVEYEHNGRTRKVAIRYFDERSGQF